MEPVKNAVERAARMEMKEIRARDAMQAMHDYEAEKLAVAAKTARLRALRLANPATTVPQEKIKKTKTPANRVR